MEQASSLGIDLGGTTVKIGAYSDDWTLMECVTLPTRVKDGPEAVVADMAASCKDLMYRHNFLPGAIGLGSPGPLDLASGRLLTLSNFPGWDYFPLRDALANAAGVPVFLESDGNTAALAELVQGAGRSGTQQSLCMWTLGTGVGSGIVLEGKLWHGAFGMAGELGHVCIDPNGPECACGGRSCLERYASATAITAAAKAILEKEGTASGQIEDLTTRDVAAMAEAGSASMIELFQRVGYWLGLSIASVVNTLELPLYVIGGGVSDAWDLFAPSLFESLEKHSYVYRLSRQEGCVPWGTELPRVVRAHLARRLVCSALL